MQIRESKQEVVGQTRGTIYMLKCSQLSSHGEFYHSVERGTGDGGVVGSLASEKPK